MNKREPHYYSVERLVHYQCAKCGGWWSIGDGPTDRELGCPWCAPPAHKRATMPKDGGGHEHNHATDGS